MYKTTTWKLYSSFRRVPQIARDKNLVGECTDVSSLVQVLNELEQSMDRYGKDKNFSRSYHEPTSSQTIDKEKGHPVNLRAQRMIAYNFVTKTYLFSVLVCDCYTCMNGDLASCQVYEDHFVDTPYTSGCQKHKKSVASTVKNVTKAGQDVIDFVVPKSKPKAKKQMESECTFSPLAEITFTKDLDSNYSSSSSSENEDNEEIDIDLNLKCPLADTDGFSSCDALPILPKYSEYLQTDKCYERTDIIHSYVFELRQATKKKNIGFLTTTDLDCMHLDTSFFECSHRKLVAEISKHSEISKLKDVIGPVSLIVLLFGHVNLRKKHSLYGGQLYSHNTTDNGQKSTRPKSNRSTPGHFVACHVNVSSGQVSVFDSLNLSPGEFNSRYFCDTTMHDIFSKLTNTVNEIRSNTLVDVRIRRMPLQRTQTANNCGPCSLMVRKKSNLIIFVHHVFLVRRGPFVALANHSQQSELHR